MTETLVAPSFPWYFFLRRFQALCAVVPLFVFLFFILAHVSLLRFGTTETVAMIMVWQKNPVVIFLECVLILLPLLFHFTFFLFHLYQGRVNVHAYPYAANFCNALQTIAGIFALVFFAYHLSQLFPVYFGLAEGQQYIQTILHAHGNSIMIVFFWACVFFTTYYAFYHLWSVLIDFGIATHALSQRAFFVFGTFCFALCVGFEVFLLVMSAFKTLVI